MPELSSVWVRIRGDLSDLEKKLAGARSKMQSVGRDLTNVGSKISVGLSGPLIALGGFAVKLGSDLEQTKVAFTTLLGSAEKAGTFIKDLQKFAASTPFEFAGLQESARQLLAFGFKADEILPTMTAIGDAVSAVGGGQAEIERVTRALGQMQAKGKVSAEEMMQLAELGIPAWELLADQIGVSIPEAMSMAAKGSIDAATGVGAILEGLGERFEGSMEAQSKTLAGLFSTLKDTLSIELGEIGSVLIEPMKQVVGAVTRAAEAFSNLSPGVQKVVIIMAGLAAALGPTLVALGLMLPAIAALLSPVGLVVVAIAALAAGLAAAWASSETFRDIVTGAWEAVSSAGQAAFGALREFIVPIIQEIQETVAAFTEVAGAAWAKWGDEITAVAEKVWGTIANVIRTQLDIIKAVLKGALDVLSNTFRLALNVLQGDWSAAWENVKNILTALKDVVIGIVDAMWEGIKREFAEEIANIVGKVREFTARVEGAFEKLSFGLVGGSIVPEMWQQIAGVWQSGQQTVGGMIEDFIGASLRRFADWAKGLGGIFGQVTGALAGIFSGGAGGPGGGGGLGAGFAGLGATLGSVIPGIGTALGGAIGGTIDIIKGLFGRGGPDKSADALKDIFRSFEGFGGKRSAEEILQRLKDTEFFNILGDIALIMDQTGLFLDDAVQQFGRAILSPLGEEGGLKKILGPAFDKLAAVIIDGGTLTAEQLTKLRDKFETARNELEILTVFEELEKAAAAARDVGDSFRGATDSLRVPEFDLSGRGSPSDVLGNINIHLESILQLDGREITRAVIEEMVPLLRTEMGLTNG